jgi:hypothetical protein
MVSALKKMMVLSLFLLAAVNVLGGKVFFKNSNYRIIVPLNATKVEKFAATELQKFLGATYDGVITLNGQTSQVTFMIGFPSEAITAGFAGIKPLNDKFGVFRVKTNILFAGDDRKDLDPAENRFYQAGTLSAVYYFLNKYAGVNFYFPGEKGYSVSKNKPLDFKAKSDAPEPTFVVRGFYTMTKEYSSKDMNIFFRRSLCNLPFWSKNDLYYIFMYNWKKRFWKTHPEYFMLRDGKRINARYPWHAPCLSNPDVIRQTAADIVEAINRNPKIEVVRIFCDAPINQCHCPGCKASRERKYCGRDTRVGEEVYGFQKKVMDLVRQAHPEVYLISQTKGDAYSQPPKLVKMGPRFTMQVLTRYPLPNANYSSYVKLVKDWNEAGARTILKSYPRYPAFQTYPIMNIKVLQKYLLHFVGLAQGTYNSDLSQGTPYAFCALGQYAQAKMLFDINVDADKLTADFCRFAYPGAEKEMIAFYHEMSDLFDKCKSLWEDPFLNLYYPGKLKKAMELLDSASEKVKKNDFFKPLYVSFQKFYNKAMKIKPSIDALLKAAPKKTIAVPLLKKIDFGKVSPEKWSGAVKEKFYPASVYKDFQKGEAYIGCDRNNLYLGLVASEKHTEKLFQACRKNHVGATWGDDCFELMLVTDPASSTYYQIVVNSLGIYRVLFREHGKPWTADKGFQIEAKSKIEKDRWIIELKIPLKQFKDSDFGHLWNFNIFRTRKLNDALKTQANKQASGLRIFSGSYHNLGEYHTLAWPAEVKPKSFWSSLKFW